MPTPISRTKAVRDLLALARPAEPVTLAPVDAVGLTAALDAAALCDVPERACSVRDGYAVRSADVAGAKPLHPVRLTVGECIRAESPDPALVVEGATARVLTGGLVPPGADAVLAEEDVETDGDAILVREPVRKGWFVRATGGEIPSGTVVAREGRIITPQAAAVMTRTRVTGVSAHPRPLARIMALGSELTAPGGRETGLERFPADNLILLRGLFAQAGASVEQTGVIPDNCDELVRFLSGPLPEIAITTGGTGNSERDFAFEAATRAGFTEVFKRIDIRPGRNMFAAHRDRTLLFGLPGPPAAVHACFHAVILSVIRRLRGLPDQAEPLKARFTQPINARPGSEWLVQCELALNGSTLCATPYAGKAVPPMFGLSQANGLAILQGNTTLVPGDEAEILTTFF
ncbi:molybdopterin molybdotransferase MoeA [Pseudodesulfovibrio indicus]|uniref:Molybdopterin molybdenumtransferase n=1 Tax=Pseudodesulfovibrio indicus TaxID=1716143 RepID=A0A126QJW7_9BACT|nr:molybdopterin molybdotransferase MoeA [Pseudodesulfovibrio indicus]AMK10310.1 molybdenum cofactor biosynthesis protein MoeA [Pseudodesulfovibrio indicus]TDT81983.1 molybdopterin molybdotransferase [Pseudodesulfovibrio indicus]